MLQIKIKCDQCKEEIYLPMYFRDARVNSRQFYPSGGVDYIATVYGTGICYCCGNQITKTFESYLSDETIIELATRKERKDD